MKLVDLLARILVIVGAINWGLMIFDINLVTLLLGSIPILVKVVYALVAASGIYLFRDILRK